MTMDIQRMDYKDTVDKVMSSHKRKVSQFAALEKELGLYFDEDEAQRIARQTMKDLNPNHASVQQVSVETIVAKARKEHKRKVSQFKAIQHDIGQYFPDKEEAARLAADVMKEFNPNDRSGKPTIVTVDSIVEKAMKDHKRKKSLYQAVTNDLGLMYDKQDVEQITKDVMKKVFANKQSAIATDPNNNAIVAGVAASAASNPNNNIQQTYIEQLKQEMDKLKNDLLQKDNKIKLMQQQIVDLTNSKTKLAQNANKCLNEMRGYLLKYQQSVFKKKMKNNPSNNT